MINREVIQNINKHTEDIKNLGSSLDKIGDNVIYSANQLNNLLNQCSVVNKLKNRTEDVTIVMSGDSVSTTNNYNTARSDANGRPPLCHQQSYVSKIEELLRWDGQIYARYDTSGWFTETCTSAKSLEYDNAWDWQVGSDIVPNLASNNKPAITRVLEGSNCSVSYKFYKGYKRCNFIYRTDYLCANQSKVSIAQGNGCVEVFDESSNTWVEANNYVFSMKENDEVLSYDLTNYLGVTKTYNYRKSMYQKRLKMRSMVYTQGNTATITITNVGDGRLNYWGVEYSVNLTMLTFINSARGGHNISRLRAFESYDIDYWKPNLILYQSQIINEGAMTTNNPGVNTVTAFADRFKTYLTDLKNKSYKPDIISWTLFVGVQSNIVNQTTGVVNTGTVTVFDYINSLKKMYNDNNILHANLFDEYYNLANEKSKVDGTNNIWTSCIKGSGVSGNTWTIDDVHFNDKGASLTYDLIRPIIIYKADLCDKDGNEILPSTTTDKINHKGNNLENVITNLIDNVKAPTYGFVKRTTDLAISNLTSTKIPFDSLVKGVGHLIWADSLPTRLNVYYEGVYVINVNLQFKPNINGLRNLSIKKSNVVISSLSVDATTATPYNNNNFSISCIAYATSGEFFEVEVFQNSGGSLDIYSGATFNICRIY